ncbi:BTAD domain-containing putative transcriptional regulator [Saccharothrix longispora]
MASATHRTIAVFDVEGFGDLRRKLPDQLAVRRVLYTAVAEALGTAGVRWVDCYREDRGDGLFVLVPPEVPKARLVESAPAALAGVLTAHNGSSPPQRRVRMRMAVHAGEVAFDDHGATATALTAAFRLLDAPAVKQALAESPAAVVLVVSRWIFDEVVRHSSVLQPGAFRPVRVRVKETDDLAWVALPGHPYPVEELAPDEVAPSSSRGVPRQLPAPPTPFAGRREELAELDAALRDEPGKVAVHVISGAGGMGKTWLALHWAHRNLHRFPDGQLFVDLRGFGPDGAPMDPAVALRGLLEALGAEPGDLPADLHAQAALFRTLVDGRRMLLVFDNAVDTDQVTALLPGSPTCTVLVTSRKRLSGLIVRHGAEHLSLDVLDDRDARALLTDRLGEERLAAEPFASDELVKLCRGYPLVLAVLAGRARTDPLSGLGALAEELRDLGVEALEEDEAGAGLPTVLSWSLRGLTAEPRQVFLLLCTAPGVDAGLPALAGLTGLPLARVRKVLRALEDASLISRNLLNRYTTHDLVRAYGSAVAERELPEEVREAARRRVVDFYLQTVHIANRLLDPDEPPLPTPPPLPDSRPHPPADVLEALAWLDGEHVNLLAAQHAAAARGMHQVVWQFAVELRIFHMWRSHLHEALTAWQAALNAARHLSDPVARIRAHGLLGNSHSRLGRHAEAIPHLLQALHLATEHGDPAELAHAHRLLALALGRRGDHLGARRHAERTLALYRTLDHPPWEAAALGLVGWYAAQLDDLDTAREHTRAALVLHRRHRNVTGEATALDCLGWIEHRSGRHDNAVRYYRQALVLVRHHGNTILTAETFDHLGQSLAALGRHDQAREAWRQALDLYHRQGRETVVERIQRQLDNLPARTAPPAP